MFENFRVFETTLAGKPISFETGKMAGLAGGSVLVRYGETTVLCNATMADKPRDGIDFFPLSVDYEEKLYAVGKIPGSFLKREARPSDHAVLTGRMIDRSMRPLFPDGMRNDVSIVMTVMSVEQDFQPEIAGMLGASLAIAISEIPWNGPVAGVNVGMVDGELILMPNQAERGESDLELTVVSIDGKICMIEAGGNEVDEAKMMEAMHLAYDEDQKLINFFNEIVAEIGKEKVQFESRITPVELFEEIKQFAIADFRVAMDTDDKAQRDANMMPIIEKIHAEFDEKYDDEYPGAIGQAIDDLQKYVVRRWLLDENKRVDGRSLDQVRPLDAEVGVIPRVHGSGMFTRGQTQVLTITTLGPVSESQRLDGLNEIDSKRYMHQYNFPSYSVGETRPSRGPGRREIGHGALAEKALLPVLPSIEDFPYAYRVVSEVLSSNGSTSQAAICGSTLSLMDAGVPISAPVAGISCGLITEGDRWMTFTDIQGIEDFYGDMDFKVGGTKKGITAIQMDIKIDGLTFDIVEEALDKCKIARNNMLDGVMREAISQPREQLSEFAPKMVAIKIHPDKIREVIGSGGKVIQKITGECEVSIDIEDDGSVFVSGINMDNVNRAVEIINTIANDPEVGAFYKGVVTRIMPFGAFVEIAPGKEGLVHISQLDINRTEKVEDVVSEGSEVLVRVTEIDDRGRLNLSRKDALIAMQKKADEEAKNN